MTNEFLAAKRFTIKLSSNGIATSLYYIRKEKRVNGLSNGFTPQQPAISTSNRYSMKTFRLKNWAFLSITALLLSLCTLPTTAQELDAYWDELSRTVDAGDFEGYKALYHADAVMVNEISGSTYPIGEAFAGWKAGFDDTKAGDMDAEVTFRFSTRLIDGTTAFETGIFQYVAHPAGEEPSVSLIHFDALTIKQDGSWVMMMERQISVATQQEWDSLAVE